LATLFISALLSSIYFIIRNRKQIIVEVKV
jgi:hypothetical protein